MTILNKKTNTVSEIVNAILSIVFGVTGILILIPLGFLFFILICLLMAYTKIQEVRKDILGGD